MTQATTGFARILLTEDEMVTLGGEQGEWYTAGDTVHLAGYPESDESMLILGVNGTDYDNYTTLGELRESAPDIADRLTA